MSRAKGLITFLFLPNWLKDGSDLGSPFARSKGLITFLFLPNWLKDGPDLGSPFAVAVVLWLVRVKKYHGLPQTERDRDNDDERNREHNREHEIDYQLQSK